ncbi:hypothetical protein HK097_008118 [Rhizophlyctis rosea]|uniref:Uncharacterized protein n=1 Tax=Rhizophlyctis rosea TaxID=64517 RepID=A0AAD5SC86_9FUNG|nr:hypothetical protein HK097_008118 [Rhizophlyctis rosea]
MSDTEPSIDRTIEETPQDDQIEEQPVKKSDKGKMTATKLANVEKARLQRKLNLEAKKKKYPQDKRSIIDRKLAEEEKLEKRIAAEAVKKAQDILDKKRLEQDLVELQELCKWKQQQQKQKLDEEDAPQKTKKKPAARETKPKAAPKKKKKVSIQEEESDNSETDVYGASRTRNTRATMRNVD